MTEEFFLDLFCYLKISFKSMEAFSGGYWLLATAIFLALGFRTDLWRDAAIVTWPLAGLLFVPCRMLFRALLRRFNK